MGWTTNGGAFKPRQAIAAGVLLLMIFGGSGLVAAGKAAGRDHAGATTPPRSVPGHEVSVAATSKPPTDTPTVAARVTTPPSTVAQPATLASVVRNTAQTQTTTKVVGNHVQVPSPSVMIQISTLAQTTTPAQLQTWLGQICPAGVSPTGQLVLQDVAASNGQLLTSFLDVLLPFLPGSSSHPCFSRVFVGTLEPTWTGSGNAYVEGVEDPAFVAAYLTQSAAVARSFVQRYPKVTVDWYVTYEANLNDLFYTAVLAGYESLLTGQIEAFDSVRSGRHVMWSPAFWFPYSSYSQNVAGMAGLTASLTQLFSGLKSAGLGIQVVDLQDYVAGSSCQPLSNQVTPADAVGWVRFLQGLGVIPAVTINPEQYALNCTTGGIVNGDPTEVLARESYYESEGLTLGPAFELRYWIPNHL